MGPHAMPYTMLFVVSAPRSGSTLLERMLETHSHIHGGPEPHLLTPLAHAGVWAKVDDAPYPPEQAAQGLQNFVAQLPGGEDDYWTACRAYAQTLYDAHMDAGGAECSVCLDKTPAYGLVLPFILRVFPDAKFIVLTRHPAAIFSSYAQSFFNGDYKAAHRYNPILERYVPAIAAFLRQHGGQCLHIRYEDLVDAPEPWMERACAYLGIPFEPTMVEYGQGGPARREGLGDPLGVAQHTRPTRASLDKWVREFQHNPDTADFVRHIIDALPSDDLDTWGYPPPALWKPLDAAPPTSPPPRPSRFTRYRLQRAAIVRLRGAVRRLPLLRRLLTQLRRACGSLLED